MITRVLRALTAEGLVYSVPRLKPRERKGSSEAHPALFLLVVGALPGERRPANCDDY